jgi:hypothetical protein
MTIYLLLLTVTVMFLWGVLSDERTGLSFVYSAGSCQRNHSRVEVLWESRLYFTVSDLWLPFSSPPTTRTAPLINHRHGPHRKHVSRVIKNACLLGRYLSTSCSTVHRKHSLCCVFAGTCILSRCPATCVTIFIENCNENHAIQERSLHSVLKFLTPIFTI